MSVQSITGLWLPLSLAMLLCACGGSNTSVDSMPPAVQSATAPRSVTQTNQEIATLIYSDNQRTPTGFYQETVPVFSGYVATSQLKTRDINSNAVLQYELCSDDFNQALQWSDTFNTNNGDNASLTGTVDTSHYFEFDRLRSGNPQGYLRQRVYKCSYLNRNSVDLLATGGSAGTLNARPLDADTLKELSEYLWQFTSYNNYGNVVLSSSGGSDSNNLTHSLIIAVLTHAITSGGCDSIAVYEWKHTLDMATGDLSLSLTSLFSFQAQQNGSMVSVCN